MNDIYQHTHPLDQVVLESLFAIVLESKFVIS